MGNRDIGLLSYDGVESVHLSIGVSLRDECG